MLLNMAGKGVKVPPARSRPAWQGALSPKSEGYAVLSQSSIAKERILRSVCGDVSVWAGRDGADPPSLRSFRRRQGYGGTSRRDKRSDTPYHFFLHLFTAICAYLRLFALIWKKCCHMDNGTNTTDRTNERALKCAARNSEPEWGGGWAHGELHPIAPNCTQLQ